MCDCLVGVFCALSEQIFITANNGSRPQLGVEKLVLGVQLVLEAYSILACGKPFSAWVSGNHINLLVDFLSLLEDVLFLNVKSRL